MRGWLLFKAVFCMQDCRFFISHVEGGDLNSFGLIWVFAGFTCTARDQLVDGLSFVGDLANSSGSHFGFLYLPLASLFAMKKMGSFTSIFSLLICWLGGYFRFSKIE